MKNINQDLPRDSVNISIKFWLVTFYQKGFLEVEFNFTVFFQKNRKVLKAGVMTFRQ